MTNPDNQPDAGLADAIARLHDNLASAPTDAERCFVSLDDHRTILAAHRLNTRAAPPADVGLAAQADTWIKLLRRHSKRTPEGLRLEARSVVQLADILAALRHTDNPRTDAVEVERLREALKDCADPMRVLERQAIKDDACLNENAVKIANDASFIKSIARTALAEEGSNVAG